MAIQYLQCSDYKLAYSHEEAPNNAITVAYLPGFRSNMTGLKATYLRKLCKEQGWGYASLDYFGHGQSEGEFLKGTIGQWMQNVETFLEHCHAKKWVLVGSSMGGWLMLLIALQNRFPIMGMVGIAVAPDFTESFLWEQMTKSQQQQLRSAKCILLPTPYNAEGWPVSLNLIEEGRNHLLLNKTRLLVNCPMRFIHGMEDRDVPYTHCLKLVELLTYSQIYTTLIKDGNHRLSREQDLKTLGKALLQLDDEII